VGAFLISRQIRQNINPPVFEQFLERRISEFSIGSTTNFSIGATTVPAPSHGLPRDGDQQPVGTRTAMSRTGRSTQPGRPDPGSYCMTWASSPKAAWSTRFSCLGHRWFGSVLKPTNVLRRENQPSLQVRLTRSLITCQTGAAGEMAQGLAARRRRDNFSGSGPAGAHSS
jgi:hypothetical protein